MRRESTMKLDILLKRRLHYHYINLVTNGNGMYDMRKSVRYF